jgi:hypothetical protein
MERDAMASVLGLVDDSGTLKLEDVLQHRVTSECRSIFNANGAFRKSQKSKLLQKLAMNVIPVPEVYTSIIDMGLIWMPSRKVSQLDFSPQDVTGGARLHTF